MISDIFRRLLSGLLSLFLFQTVVFFIVQIILPGDLVSHLALTLSTSESQELRQTLSGHERQRDPKSCQCITIKKTRDRKKSHPSNPLIPLKLCFCVIKSGNPR